VSDDDHNDHEGFRIIEGGEPVDDEDIVAPGRSVFGDEDDVSFDEDDASLPHWSEPATGSVPQVGMSVVSEEQVDEDEESAEPMLVEAEPDEMAAWADISATPRWADDSSGLPPMEEVEPVGHLPAGEDFFGFDDSGAPSPPPVAAEPAPSAAPPGGADRDMGAAVLVGVGLGAVILLAMAAGPAIAVVVVTIVLGLAAVEFFNAVRVAGYHPAVLLGLAAVVTMPLAVYWRGEQAMPVVLVLSIVFAALWYLTGVGPEGPLRGMSVTVFGVVYIGLLGSHAALLLSVPDMGTGLLTAAILVTVAYDIGGLVVGRAAGRTPLSAASPNKTVEGLIGGCVACIGTGLAMGLLAMPAPVGDAPGDLTSALLLGVVAAVVAPIGDLTESLLKRDLGIKDMGAILPGHGGVLDRFDALLFVLPATYYVALLTDIL
jgi:phosphatidate cytidylyltransferase